MTLDLSVGSEETNDIQTRSLVLATGRGNQPVVRVWTGKTVPFASRSGENPDLQLLCGPNLAMYPSTREFHWNWLDPSGPISGSAFQVVQFIVTFRYPTVNRKILTMVPRCSFWM